MYVSVEGIHTKLGLPRDNEAGCQQGLPETSVLHTRNIFVYTKDQAAAAFQTTTY